MLQPELGGLHHGALRGTGIVRGYAETRYAAQARLGEGFRIGLPPRRVPPALRGPVPQPAIRSAGG